MTRAGEEKVPAPSAYVRDHLANERTFLAWVRTSIGVMAFGFVVEKFALFMNRLAYLLGEEESLQVSPVSLGYSSVFGIILVALGALMGLLAYMRYRRVEIEINEGSYKSSLLLDIMLSTGLVAIGAFLVFYMIFNLQEHG